MTVIYQCPSGNGAELLLELGGVTEIGTVSPIIAGDARGIA